MDVDNVAQIAGCFKKYKKSAKNPFGRPIPDVA